jgi:hypothetical protein
LGHGAAWIGLERQRVGHPARAEIAGQRVEVALGGVREAVEQSVCALEHRAWPDESCPRQQRRADARLRRPTGVQPLGPGAFGEIFDDAAGQAAGDAERIDDLLRIEAERRADPGRRAHRAEDRSRVKARLVNGLRHHETQAAQHLGADRDPDLGHAPIRIMPFAGGEHRRHDHRAGMHRAALERIVEILAMGGSAVDQGSAGRGQPPPVPDCRAGTIVVAAGQCAADIVLVARGDTQADHVDHQILAFPRGYGRQGAGPQ